jgi:diaminohydroxyphosphoribosylaminopyrimidine deaminase/5-amino-6-(5-phosphoribosylamino)uracil reductase
MSAMQDENYMQRCIDLAAQGIGNTAPNPMVGAVVVYQGAIIGEGYHHRAGEPHAEVNAINAVQNPSLLPLSTLYVNLEPCAHCGKTPPCADLIVEKKIPRVVIGSSDPFPQVAGRGIQKLVNAGIEVSTGILEKACIQLNKRFYTFYQTGKPYIILKWAQTNDGFMAPLNQKNGEPLKITNPKTNQLVHQWRSQEQAIMVGKHTILKDDPQLNVRLVEGRQPIPFILGNPTEIPAHYKIHQMNPVFFGNREQFIEDIYAYCQTHRLLSILVEGGPRVLNTLIKKNLWNEARIITNTHMNLGSGLPAPRLNIAPTETCMIETDQINFLYNPQHG